MNKGAGRGYLRLLARWGLVTLMFSICLITGIGSPLAQADWESTRGTVSHEVGANALKEALRYAEVEYELGGEIHRGVAYRWGGRQTVDEYLAAIDRGAVPGMDAGVDASALVVNAYKSANPDQRFISVQNGTRRLLSDATSSGLYQWNVELIEVGELRAGDLIFFQDGRGAVSGVAMFERRSGPNVHFVVASASSGKVVRTFLNVNNEYWNTRVKAVGRLLAITR